MANGQTRSAVVGLVTALALLAISVSARQIPRPRGGRPASTQRGFEYASLDDFDGGFQFCRIVFRNASNGDGNGWDVDWPRADENLSIRLSELTRTPVSLDETGQPKHLLLRLTAPELFHCPFVMMTEPGGAYFDDQEAAGLRSYLLKGGFLWRTISGARMHSTFGRRRSARRFHRQSIPSWICRWIMRSSTPCSTFHTFCKFLAFSIGCPVAAALPNAAPTVLCRTCAPS
jgi:hypothetical protein